MPQQKASQKFETNVSKKVDDSGLRQVAGYHLKRAYNIIRSDLSKALEPLGLRITTYSSLILIVGNPGIRQSELATALDIERPNMVVILDDLEQRGWITRERVVTDRRAYALFATLAGRNVSDKAMELDSKSEAKLMSSLTEIEVKTLTSALNKIERIGEEQ